MKHQWIAKLVLLVAWPLIAALIAACIGFVLVMAWVLIPLGRITRKEDDSGYTMTMPWDDLMARHKPPNARLSGPQRPAQEVDYGTK